jgi:hypothetical protein
MNPGYSTDRDPGYTKTIHSGTKGINTTMYSHDNAYNYLNKSIQGSVSPPLNQIKTNTIEEAQRGKYAGIKLISSSGNSGIKPRESKHYEENPLFHGVASTTNKTAGGGYLHGGNPMTTKNGAGRVERGYETLREKKIIEKYPVE